MTADEFLATCWTTAGDTGFSAFGLPYAGLVEAERGYGLAGVRSLFADNGISHIELELLTDWWADGPRRAASDAVRGGMLRAIEALGARTFKIGPDVADEPWELDVWAKEFAPAAQADDVGARLGVEPLPWSNLRTVHDGLRLVEAAGHAIVGESRPAG